MQSWAFSIGIGGGRVGLMGMMGLTSGVDGGLFPKSRGLREANPLLHRREDSQKVYEEIGSGRVSSLRYTQRKDSSPILHGVD